MEKLYYELRPYGFILIAIIALGYAPKSGLLFVSSVLLLTLSLNIITWRFKNRRVIAGLMERYQ